MRDRTIFFEKGPRAVLLFHAFTSNPNDMRGLARALERADYTVYAPTLSGHGTENPDDIFKYGIEDWKKDGEKAYQYLKDKGYDEIAVFGLSLGGVVATHLMLTKDVKAAGTFSSPVISNEHSHVPRNFMMWYEYMKKNEGYSKEEIAGQKTSAEPQLDTILKHLNEFIQTMVPNYKDVSKNVFIAQGGQDEMIDPHQAGKYRDALVQANVDFHWYDDAPHVITTGQIGKQLQIDLLSFLSTLEWDGGNS
ncbi:alpha/beta hydrolase [Marinilactibacillus piezotolerans]|uniref:alpha/beta hydrolase n=1 Tax=Marinilactibacillus piezotolerans TaxID=258723 RepID=UPI0009B040BF|nr:alpha/beta fold hydrolase [Marinilactibacillus piezotolerans]